MGFTQCSPIGDVKRKEMEESNAESCAGQSSGHSTIYGQERNDAHAIKDFGRPAKRSSNNISMTNRNCSA
jgi:hypothetical protein